MSTHIKIVKRNHYAFIPEKSSENAVGFDIKACLYDDAFRDFGENHHNQEFDHFLENYSLSLAPTEAIAISTGLTLELPENMEMDVKSRSGLFIRQNILAQGTIDPDYRGEVKIMLFNLGRHHFLIKHGDRIAQAVFREVFNQNNLFTEVKDISELSHTERHEGGFGSTGIQ